MKNILRITAINFMVFCTFIVSVEILGQLAYLMKHGNFLPLEKTSPFQTKIFELHPYLAGRLKSSIVVTKNNKTITTTKYNTRWTGAEQDDHNLIRIAVLGGSTTFGTGVTDKDSWPALLQAQLGKQYAVINYGIPGYSTAENIIQMSLLVPEKRPQIVIFYEGWNDIRNYHESKLGADYYGHGIRQQEHLLIPISGQQNKFRDLKNIFATARLVDEIQKNITNSPKKIKNSHELFDKPDQFVDRIYVRNLNTLKLLSENIGAFTMFIPQVLNYEDFYEKEGGRLWTRHIKDEAMPILMDRFNSHMNGLCSKGEQNCKVLNEVSDEKWLTNNFVDDGHLSKSGGLKFAKIVAQFIRSKSDNILSEGSSQ